MSKNDGGPAFPQVETGYSLMTEKPCVKFSGGMSLRDYFAAAALKGELAAQDARHEGKGTGVLTPDSMNAFAWRVWAIANAMLTERDK